MKKKSSLRVQLVVIMLLFVAGLLGLVYFVQTTFLDDFYKANKIKSIENVGRNVATLVGENDMDYTIEHVAMSNEVCIRVVSNNDEYSYTGACTLRGLDNMTINRIANEVAISDSSEKLFDDFHYQRRPDEKPEDVYIFAKLFEINTEKVMVLVSSGITPLNATISTIKSQYLIIAGVVVAMTLVLALILSRFIVEPIKQINRESQNLSKGAYDGTNVKPSSEEFAQLNSTLINANEDILKAEKAKKELLGNVSHDLRTPLTMIVGYGEMIRDLPEENNEDNINVIIDEAKRLSTLVDDLIDISKMDSISVELDKKEVNINELLTSVYHQYELYCRNQGIDLSLQLSDDINVQLDEKRIKQVLYNFVNNALNYNDKDNKKIIIGCEKNKEFYRIFVYDNGEGIEKSDLKNIWDRYYKVDKQHRRHHIGSGIGLSLAKELLVAHGFNYGADSKKGEYSKFYFDVKTV